MSTTPDKPAAGGVEETAGFPDRIMELLLKVTDRKGTETKAPWEDADGLPLQDDADAALNWIASRSSVAPVAWCAARQVAEAVAAEQAALIQHFLAAAAETHRRMMPAIASAAYLDAVEVVRARYTQPADASQWSKPDRAPSEDGYRG